MGDKKLGTPSPSSPLTTLPLLFQLVLYLHQHFRSSVMLKSLALGAAALFMAFGSVKGQSGLQANYNLRQPAGVSYQARMNCPELCSASGPTPRGTTGASSSTPTGTDA